MQSYRIDYQETFAPVVKLNTIRVLLSLVVNWDWPFHQLDIKNAFLNGDLEEEVHIEIPLGFETKTNINKFYKLKKIPIWSQEISLSLVWLFYQCCKEVLLLPMSIWPHSVCKTHSQVKNCYYHHLCEWHNLDRRSWGRNRQIQDFSCLWVRN